MKILGINISHDTSVAVVDNGEVTQVHEEDRVRRSKYWDPQKLPLSELNLQAIEHKGLHDCDHAGFATFDRRTFDPQFSDFFAENRLLQKDVIQAITAQQMSNKRWDEIQEEFGSEVFPTIRENVGNDEEIKDAISNQLETPKENIHMDVSQHHYYHAVCGSHLSPYEESLVITWDGGGANTYYDEWPGYQEIECIWHHQGDKITPLWKRLSNHRMLDELQGTYFFGWDEDCLKCLQDEEHEIDGVPCVFTAMPSMGMNFSNMSYALGCDKLGRAAGKVMGMASYSKMLPNVHTKHTSAQRLEHDSLDHAKTVIQRAIDMKPDVKNIVLSGGYSLNCTNNYKYLQAFPDHQFFVDPIPHDGGTAVGVALDLWRKLNA